MQSLKKFDLAALSEIDSGKLAIAFEQALRRCAADCDDRPGEDKARTVSLSVAIEPVVDDQGLCEDVKASVSIADSLPKRKSKPYSLALKKGGILSYHPDSLGDHSEQTLDFDSIEE